VDLVPIVPLLALVLPGLDLAGPATECGSRVSLRTSHSRTIQGGVFLVEVATDLPRGTTAGDSSPTVTVTWNGAAVPTWPSPGEGKRRALLGVDLQRTPGPIPLTVSGTGVSCSLTVEVEDGRFVVRRLQVEKRYVDLSPRDQARVKREAARLRAVFAKTSPERLWDGPFVLPVNGAGPSDNFGQKRILNGEPRSPHSGVDFSAESGTAVTAPQRGRVVLAQDLFLSGRTVVLDHGMGLFTFYGHLSATDVVEGREVETGDRLGAVGATGRVTGPHLHWSMRILGARVNPLALVALLAEASS
jgi:hypothetical protein